MNTIQRAFITFVCIILFGGWITKTPSKAVEVTAGNNRLAPCPKFPNCVSSIDPVDEHFVEPLRYKGDKDAAYQRLVNLIASQQRARIVVKEADYLRVEFKSAVFGFVDDVAFSFSADQTVIDVRSESRVGYYDFGVNRKRIEDIRNRWN